MAENICKIPSEFKEAVCIDAGRIYDSCCDRDCLEDLRCYFSEVDQAKIEQAKSVRVRSAEVAKTYIDVEPITFNKGYYSCDITFFFIVEFELFTSLSCAPTIIKGIANFNKKAILFGGDGNVKIFSNNETLENDCDEQLKMTTNAPKCTVQVVDPIPLSAKIGKVRDCFECCHIPKCLCNCCGGNIVVEHSSGTPTIYVTLGLFSIIQLIRNVQMLIPVYDFCLPNKNCDNTSEQPCDVFSKIKFPNEDFFPIGECGKETKFNCCK